MRYNALTPIDPVGSAMSGTAGALRLSQGVGEMSRQNALREFMGQNAGAVMSGDPNAISGLGAINPEFAMQAGQNAERRAVARERLSIDRERLDLVRAQSALTVAAETARMTAAQKASEQAEIDRHLNGLSSVQNEEQFERLKTQIIAESPEYADQIGQYTFEDVPYLVGMLEGASEGLKVGQGSKPGFRPATPDEAAQYGATSGQIDDESGRFYPVNPPKGMRITSDGKGGFTMTEGAGVGSDDQGSVSPSSPASMVSTIDGILNDPAFDSSTGLLSTLQNVPGTPQRRFGSRVKQLDGQAFLQAFESLKGGGQITEIEGQKATQAIGRLDSAQKSEDYRDALNELRQLLVTAQSRPAGWATQKIKDDNTPDIGVTEDGYRFLGGDPGVAANWEKVE